jgi:hypothetical protein
VNSPPPKPEVILTNFFAEPTVLLVPITSRVIYAEYQLYEFKYIYSNKLNERKKCIEKKMFKVFSLTGLKIFKNLTYQVLKCKFFRLTEFAIVLI